MEQHISTLISTQKTQLEAYAPGFNFLVLPIQVTPWVTN